MSVSHAADARHLACVPFTVIDEAVHHLDTPSEPWSIQFELRVAGQVDDERLRAAVRSAAARHPMARARKLPARRTDRHYRWEITSDFDVDPLSVVDCPTDDGLRRVRAELQSLSVPLVESPPFRARLVHHPGGDFIMLNVNHAAFDGFGALRLLRSVAHAYSGDHDPATRVDLDEARAIKRRLRATDRNIRDERRKLLWGKLRDLGQPTARLAPEGGTDRPGYGFEHLSLTPDQTEALSGVDSRWTVNDVMLAALVAAIDEWNADHGKRSGRIGLLVPVNLRPDDWHEDPVTNFVLDSRVVVAEPAGVTAGPYTARSRRKLRR